MAGTEQQAEPPPPQEAQARSATDRTDLTLPDLARAILAREFRPRMGEIRRLAEAALAAAERKKKKKKAAGKAVRKKRLAKIPGQKAKR